MMDDLIFSNLISKVTSKDQEKEEKDEQRREILRKKRSERKRNGIHSSSCHSFHSLWICVAMLLLNMMKSCEAFDKLPNGNGQPSSNRAGSLGGVVDEWIKGGAARATVVNKYGEIRNWNTSDVISMKFVFYEKKTFNEDISKWNVSSVTNMGNCTSLSFSFSLSVLVFINIF